MHINTTPTTQTSQTNAEAHQKAVVEPRRVSNTTLRKADFLLDAITDQVGSKAKFPESLRGELYFAEALGRLAIITACLISPSPREQDHGRRALRKALKQRKALLAAQEVTP